MSYSVPRCSSRCARAVLVLALLSTAPAPLFAQGPEDKLVPEDTCILELTLPEGATVKVDSRDYGTKRWLTYSDLQPGKTYVAKVHITFPGGGVEDHKLMIEGGRLVRLASAGTSARTPELVLNTRHRTGVECFALSPDGRYVLSGSEDHTAILWEFSTGRKIRDFRGHTKEVTSVAFSPDGRQALTSQYYGPAILWDLPTGKRIRQFGKELDATGHAIFSPDGRRVLTNDGNMGAVVWDKATGRKVSSFRKSETVGCLAFSPDGRKVLTNGYDPDAHKRLVVLWDATAGRQLMLFRGHQGTIRSVAFHPDGRLALSGSADKTAILWDATTGQMIHTFDFRSGGSGSEFKVKCVAFSPDGRRLLTVTRDNLSVWDTTTKQKIRSFSGKLLHFHTACFTPNGQPVALAWKAGLNGVMLLCDIATGETFTTWHLQEEWAFHQPVHAAISPDGRHIAISGGEAQNSMLFDTGAGRLTARLVVDAQESLAGRQQFTDQIGLITAAFYAVKGSSRAVGTGEGKDREGETGKYDANKIQVGNLLGVVHIRYVEPEVLRKVQEEEGPPTT